MHNASPASSRFFFSPGLQKAALGCALASAAFPSFLRASVQHGPAVPSAGSKVITPREHAASVLEGIDGNSIFLLSPTAISRQDLPPSKEVYMAVQKDQVIYGVMLEGKDLKEDDSCEVIFEKKVQDHNLPRERIVLLNIHARETCLELKERYAKYMAEKNLQAKRLATSLPAMIQERKDLIWKEGQNGPNMKTKTEKIGEFDVTLARVTSMLENDGSPTLYFIKVQWRQRESYITHGVEAEQAWKAAELGEKKKAQPDALNLE